MQHIVMTNGRTTTVDDADFERLSRYTWSEHDGYVVRYEHPDGRTKMVLMHRDILQLPDGVEADHKDRNGLNNVRSNLRTSTRQGNCRNRGKWGTGRYKGVYAWKYRDSQYYRARITINGQVRHLGMFQSAEEAARAYDAEAKKQFGEFAVLNFI